jgi:pilus assembly protein TadC
MEQLLSNDISHVIQLAVAPVFLLAAISQALNVLSTRLGRIIDRGRRLNELQDAMPSSVAIASDSGQDLDDEQFLLAKRARLIHRAIKLCTMSALFVTLVIVSLFVDVLLGLPLDQFIAGLFGVALVCLITAFITFLREIELGTNAFRFGPYNITDRRHRRSK